MKATAFCEFVSLSVGRVCLRGEEKRSCWALSVNVVHRSLDADKGLLAGRKQGKVSTSQPLQPPARQGSLQGPTTVTRGSLPALLVAVVPMASSESKILDAERKLDEEICKPTRNEALIVHLKVNIARLELKEEECKPTRNEARIARLKVDIARLELDEERCKPTRDQESIARLKVDIAELKLEEEECKPTRNEARIARLKVDIAELKQKEENLAETDKGTQIRILLRPSPSCFLPPLLRGSLAPLFAEQCPNLLAHRSFFLLPSFRQFVVPFFPQDKEKKLH